MKRDKSEERVGFTFGYGFGELILEFGHCRYWISEEQG